MNVTSIKPEHTREGEILFRTNKFEQKSHFVLGGAWSNQIQHLDKQYLDKAARPSFSNIIWILSSAFYQLNQLFSNSEAAMLSSNIAFEDFCFPCFTECEE